MRFREGFLVQKHDPFVQAELLPLANEPIALAGVVLPPQIATGLLAIEIH